MPQTPGAQGPLYLLHAPQNVQAACHHHTRMLMLICLFTVIVYAHLHFIAWFDAFMGLSKH